MSPLLNRRSLLTSTLALSAAAVPWSVQAKYAGPPDPGFDFEIQRTEEEWRAILSEEEYELLRNFGTEPRQSSAVWDETRPGTYACKGCELPLYNGEWKKVLDIGFAFFYHSEPYAVMTRIDGVPERVIEGQDLANVSVLEVHCRRCGSHMGHMVSIKGEVLHCINGAGLIYTPETA